MGADVIHPSTGTNEQSYVAVTAAIDPGLTKWLAECRIQKSGVEYIRDIRMVTIILIKAYGQRNGHLPEQIIMCRGGVSEDHFISVLQKEVSDIKEACEEIKMGYKPRLTFLVSYLVHSFINIF